MTARYLALTNGVPRGSAPATAYDASTIISGTITTGTTVTLPSSGTYDSSELQVFMNNIPLEYLSDYIYVGIVPRTGVQFTFDLIDGDDIRFKKYFA